MRQLSTSSAGEGGTDDVATVVKSLQSLDDVRSRCRVYLKPTMVLRSCILFKLSQGTVDYRL